MINLTLLYRLMFYICLYNCCFALVPRSYAHTCCQIEHQVVATSYDDLFAFIDALPEPITAQRDCFPHGVLLDGGGLLLGIFCHDADDDVDYSITLHSYYKV